jgi:hypothetical protein
VHWASVPETAVNEHSYPNGREYYVDPSSAALDGTIDAKSESEPMEFSA